MSAVYSEQINNIQYPTLDLVNDPNKIHYRDILPRLASKHLLREKVAGRHLKVVEQGKLIKS